LADIQAIGIFDTSGSYWWHYNHYNYSCSLISRNQQTTYMKDLKFICAQPDDVYYTWQVHLWLESLKKLGHSDKAIVLVYTPSFREYNNKWEKIMELYPEADFAFYKDTGDVSIWEFIFLFYVPIA
jgi:hypothetical protein